MLCLRQHSMTLSHHRGFYSNNQPSSNRNSIQTQSSHGGIQFKRNLPLSRINFETQSSRFSVPGSVQIKWLDSSTPNSSKVRFTENKNSIILKTLGENQNSTSSQSHRQHFNKFCFYNQITDICDRINCFVSSIVNMKPTLLTQPAGSKTTHAARNLTFWLI